MPTTFSETARTAVFPSAQSTAGQSMHQLITDLYPICRSITGNGLRQTLAAIREHIPLQLHEVPTGTGVFDWTIPKEWNIRDAYVKSSHGERLIDFQRSNLHVVNYSIPVATRMGLDDLKRYLHSCPEHPDWIPYRTSYYKEAWGFCLSHRQLLELPEDEYEVCIDSSLEDGSLTYGEYFLPGTRDDEVLVSCHVCHPSLCNDNLSGLALSVFLAKHLSTIPLTLSYRFLFIPGTIGAITWLALNQERVARIKHGLVLANVGDAGKITYKKSRRGNADIDRAAIHVLQHTGQDYEVVDFSPYGYDERQYCSPGFDLPVGCLSRTPWGCFPQYHTSADNLELVRPESLADSLAKCFMIVEVLEKNRTYRSQNPYCEPHLGKRSLYRSVGGGTDGRDWEQAILWVLNLSDGEHSLLDIAQRSRLPFNIVAKAAGILTEHALLKACA